MTDLPAGPALAHPTRTAPVRQRADDLPTPRGDAPAPRLRTVWRFTDWTLSRAANEPDLPPVRHRFQC
ncbi:hypothetical protein ACFRAR_16305 [Kitasatospora sp. NPDC056651]|uniref:hypothetical protein n=1 Tax=Kitasatospora sp. NPDC056651 TaxID=3345892 RepID=UPI0036AC8FF7